jgi:hypothetical protein
MWSSRVRFWVKIDELHFIVSYISVAERKHSTPKIKAPLIQHECKIKPRFRATSPLCFVIVLGVMHNLHLYFQIKLYSELETAIYICSCFDRLESKNFNNREVRLMREAC